MATVTRPFHATPAIAHIRRIDAEMERLAAERATYVANLLDSITGTGTVEFPNGKVTLSENNTYDKDTMTAALLPGQVRRCSKMTLDSAMVKAAYPEVYAAAKVNRGRKVTVKG